MGRLSRIPKSFGLKHPTNISKSEGSCDLCFGVDEILPQEAKIGRDKEFNSKKNNPFIQCRECKLFVHLYCYPFPEGKSKRDSVDNKGYFTCIVCEAILEDGKMKQKVKEENGSPSSRTTSRTTGEFNEDNSIKTPESDKRKILDVKRSSDRKKKRSDYFMKIDDDMFDIDRLEAECMNNAMISPEPIPEEIDAESDGRTYPLPSEILMDSDTSKQDTESLDIYCLLCRRRDVRGCMRACSFNGNTSGKPRFFVHATCAMASRYTRYDKKTGRITGVQKTLKENLYYFYDTRGGPLSDSIKCEACSRGGGLLINCAHKHSSEKKHSISGKTERSRRSRKIAIQNSRSNATLPFVDIRCSHYVHPLCAELTGLHGRIEANGRNVSESEKNMPRLGLVGFDVDETWGYNCALHSGADVCVVCNSTTNQNKMLECDNPKCNDGYHMGCLDPPKKKIPDGDWFCKNCTDQKRRRRRS